MCVCVCVCMCLYYIYFTGYKRIMEDVEMMLGKKPNYFWVACWIGFSPAILLV